MRLRALQTPSTPPPPPSPPGCLIEIILRGLGKSTYRNCVLHALGGVSQCGKVNQISMQKLLISENK